MNLSIFLQAATANIDSTATSALTSPSSVNYLNLLMKGGWVMIPIIILSILAVYFMIERFLVINKLGKFDSIWFSRITELISESKIDQAYKFSIEKPYVIAKIIGAGLKDKDEDIDTIEKTMEVEGRQQISIMENHLNYLSIIASIAPMLGFLGTIFGVITIFYNISQTANLDIASISDGLYQKMICSGAGLLVGIIAYAGFYILNSKIDSVVVKLDAQSNEILKLLRGYKKIQEEEEKQTN